MKKQEMYKYHPLRSSAGHGIDMPIHSEYHLSEYREYQDFPHRLSSRNEPISAVFYVAGCVELV